jgi:hypothetical protein
MKKFLALLVAAFALSATVGCGGSSSSTTPPAKPAEKKPEEKKPM